MKKYLCLLASIILCLALFTGCGSQSDTNTSTADDTTSENVEETNSDTEAELITGTHHAVIDVKDFGTITVELYADKAPVTTTNFISLVNSGFYDGLTFHRIIDGFMIQGGDPTGTGMGGSENNIVGEFSLNGYANDISHTRGVISMARAKDYNSASSQFFIMHQDYPSLDGQYAAFGIVTEGIEVVDKIAESAIVEDNNGTVLPENQPIINSIKMID